MKPIPAIVESDIARVAARVDECITRLRDAEQHAEQADRRAQSAHEAARTRRLDLGRALIDARKHFKPSGKNAKAWSDFLAVRRLTLEQAQDAMKYAGFVEGLTGGSEDPPAKLPTREEAGLDSPPPLLSLVPDQADEVEIDRDTWCTPKWITDAIGRFELDPCSNDRSTVQAAQMFDLVDRGADGLVLATAVAPTARVFINPPYSDVPPWIAAYKHTRFCFLLKLDTSTKWFAELYAATGLILIPRKRVQFEPPPGVPPERAIAQQFPHALFYAHAEDATDAIRELCWTWRVEH